jgi:hypothetical protein
MKEKRYRIKRNFTGKSGYKVDETTSSDYEGWYNAIANVVSLTDNSHWTYGDQKRYASTMSLEDAKAVLRHIDQITYSIEEVGK